MRGIPRPSPAMVVALIALVVAIGGTAAALPGKYTVGQDDLKKSSVGARSLGKIALSQTRVVGSLDQQAKDGEFTETEGQIVCPAQAPFALDPSIGNMGPTAFQMKRTAIPNRWGGPLGYRFVVLTDEGPEISYTMTVNCLPAR